MKVTVASGVSLDRGTLTLYATRLQDTARQSKNDQTESMELRISVRPTTHARLADTYQVYHAAKPLSEGYTGIEVRRPFVNFVYAEASRIYRPPFGIHASP